MDIASLALGGMQQAELRLEKTAVKLATASGPDAAGMVELIESRNAFKTNVKLLATADEMQRSLLDVFG